MSYDPSIFNINPYYDDYSPSKSFLRVLFKPGYAVQARELTQIQSILQNQVSKIGDHLFKDGSRIVGGSVNVRNTNYLMVKGNTAGLFGVSEHSFVLNGTVKTGTGVDGAQPEARVVHYMEPDTTDGYVVLVLDYISGASFANLNTSDITFVSSDGSDTRVFKPATDTWANGRCKLVSVDEGIFYVDGFFARNEQQYFVPGRTVANGASSRRDFEYGTAFQDLTTRVGLAIERDSVTENEDSTLRDPAIGSYNYNAPGADRFKINFTLDQRKFDQSIDDFVELVRFENGKITRKVEKVAYSEIQKLFEERTYDESGSYVVRPFDVSVDLVGTTLEYTFSPGKAYIRGVEVETQYPQKISVPAARTTVNETNLQFQFAAGNWIGVCAGNGTDTITSWGSTFGTALGTTLNNGSADVYFRNSSNVEIGKAKVHGLVPYSFTSGSGLTNGIYRMYLYGVCAGSIIAGASTAVVMPHGSGLGSGRTLAVFSPNTGTTFSQPNKADFTPLVYDVKPGYAIKEFSALEFYGKLVSNTIRIDGTYAVNAPITYTVNKSSNLGNLPGTVTNSVLGFPTTFTISGSDRAEDIQQVTFVSTDGGAGTTAMAYSPGHASSLVGFKVSSDGTSFIKIEIPNGQHPNGFTAGNVRMIFPARYTLDSTALGANKTNNIRTKTRTSGSRTVVNNTSNVLSDAQRNNRKYIQLSHFDVYSIVSITLGGVNVTSDFELDDGQRDSFYDYSRVYVKPEVANKYGIGTENIVVNYEYFSHGGYLLAPFVGANSYVGITYEHIPLYTNERTGKTISLANCIDFRHSGPTANTPLLKPFGLNEFPSAFANTTVSYTHYLPRIDKLKLKANPQDGSPLFYVEQGDPDIVPMSPPDSDDSITLYDVLVPAYTHKANDVVLTVHENKRYTMSDIGRIEKRVDDVETFASLTSSEIELESKSLIPSARSLGLNPSSEPLKTSLYVDEFIGHGSGDVASDEHICSVDYEYGELRPYFNSYPVVLGTMTPGNNTTLSSDGICTLSYGVTAHVYNLGYTKTIKANPNNTTNWLGFLEFRTNSIDTSWDNTFRPLVKTNALGENDNWISSDARNTRGFGTQWNDWESMWSGVEVRNEETDAVQLSVLETPRNASPSAVAVIDSGSAATGVGRRITNTLNEKIMSYVKSRQLKNRIKSNINNRIVDRSVLPYIKNQTVTVQAYGLKPNTSRLSLFFDGVSLAGNITSDSNGSCNVSFTIPSNRFTVGEKLVRISDSFDPQNSTTAADAIFYCSGVLTQRDSGSYSTRPPVFRRQNVSSNGIIKNPFNREVSYESNPNTVGNNQWSDPLCQTFIVDKKTYPDGIFISSVDLYFAEKDAVLPVTVQIRPTVAGYPSPSVSLPFSTVTKLPSQVTVDPNNGNPIATNFAFTSPVYLEPGEYAIAVVTNSGKYSLYSSDSALNNSIGDRAGNNPSVGTLYVSQNTGTWVADFSTDIAFAVNRCVFNLSDTGYAQYPNASWSGGGDILKFSAPEIVPVGCSVTRTVGTTRVYNNQNLYPTTPLSSSPVSYVMRRGINLSVSPVIDFGAFYGTAVDMFLSSTSAPYTTSSYVSRVVSIPQDSVSQGIFVFANAMIPSGAQVKVYCKYSGLGEADILKNASWRLMTQLNSFTSSSEADYREVAYGINAPSGSISSYQIKIEFLAPSTASYYYTPSLKNIKVVTWR